ncbi:hypothetical protein H696_02731 [Fonticula alba]|uniref:Tr-type G domain-containing protein n=1 Tax=Fonticula alba TaxID=691883 RepID=A0A058Z7Z3_FONAL|nr:hypothetical protein H696_02731 [Fonticula alba]KCV70395.1 hypothetical protein H696_02731 [Fonticula alba]|eukprot:XP_009494911.1 hypothetical protein H696_02731 [Fonticula alba]
MLRALWSRAGPGRALTAGLPRPLATGPPRAAAVAAYHTHQQALEKVRNIGIIAHIDAGKTTFTERVLLYTGQLARPGEVHDGAATMDFLPAEQERGITIQAAATTLGWRDQQVNLIDTPGHVDFGFEVERSVRVLDGAVTVLDAVAGVQAQTVTVWRQASRRGVARIMFINKLDRVGASIDRSLASARSRLGARTLLLQTLIGGDDATGPGFDGALIDLVRLEYQAWQDKLGHSMAAHALVPGLLDYTGQSRPEASPLPPGAAAAGVLTPADIALALAQRAELVETVAGLDDTLLELLLSYDSEEDLTPEAQARLVPPAALAAAIRRLTLANRVTPVLVGSALQNRGVQPVLDAVVDYLPSPLERPPVLAEIQAMEAAPSTEVMSKRARAAAAYAAAMQAKKAAGAGKKSGKRGAGPASEAASAEPPAPVVDTTRSFTSDPEAPLCAMAFKVVVDRQRGPLVHVRVYSGRLEAREQLLIGRSGVRERPSKLLRVYADKVEEVDAISAGDIGVIVGMKATRTGDTILSGTSKERFVLPGVSPPPAVFFRSVEPLSLADEGALSEALASMVLEDPSLTVRHDAETGQTLLCGLGELHLEVAEDRLRRDYQVGASFGPVLIAYREGLDFGQGGPGVMRLPFVDGAEAKAEAILSGQAFDGEDSDDEFDLFNEHLLPPHEADGVPGSGDMIDPAATAPPLRDPSPLGDFDGALPARYHVFDREINGQRARVGFRLRMMPTRCEANRISVAPLSLEELERCPSTIRSYGYQRLLAEAATSALHSSGTKAHFPLAHVHLIIDQPWFALDEAQVARHFPNAEPTFLLPGDALVHAARGCILEGVSHLARARPGFLLEPVMRMAVTVGSQAASHAGSGPSGSGDLVGVVVSDLTGRRDGRIVDIRSAAQDLAASEAAGAGPASDTYTTQVEEGEGAGDTSSIVVASVPLRTMVGYSTALRSATGGNASFEAALERLSRMPHEAQTRVLQDLGYIAAPGSDGGWGAAPATAYGSR